MMMEAGGQSQNKRRRMDDATRSDASSCASGNALKRRREMTLTELERQRAREEGLSLETRARRKREVLQLRSENVRLKEERDEFLNKIQELEQESLDKLSKVDPRLASENEMLRAQIEEHSRFISRFTDLLNASLPKARECEEVIYKEGSDAAQAYVQSLVSQSQSHWMRQRVPDSLLEVGPLQNVQMSYSFGSDFFGTKEKDTDARLNLRFDAQVRANIGADVVADVLWRAFSVQEMHNRFYSTSGLELKPVEGKMPDENTRVVHYTRKAEPGTGRDQDVVFVVNRERKLLAKSTLAPPRNVVGGRGAGKSAAAPGLVGEASAIVVATTSTTLYAQEDLAAKDDSRVKALVVKGAVVWDEEDSTRILMVWSSPDSYKVLNSFEFGDIVNARGVMSQRFTGLVEGVCKGFGAMLEEQASAFARGDLPVSEIDVHLDVPEDRAAKVPRPGAGREEEEEFKAAQYNTI